MKVINPTDKDLQIQYKGDVYSVKANDSVNVPSDVAEYWKSMIHNFLQVEEESEQKTSPETEIDSKKAKTSTKKTTKK